MKYTNLSFLFQIIGGTREQTLERCPNLALASTFFAPGTKGPFSPGWYYQPGLKVPAQRSSAETKAFSPGLGYAPGIKINI